MDIAGREMLRYMTTEIVVHCGHVQRPVLPKPDLCPTNMQLDAACEHGGALAEQQVAPAASPGRARPAALRMVQPHDQLPPSQEDGFRR